MNIIGESVTCESFTAMTARGHVVFFAYQQPVGLRMASGEFYVRFDKYRGSLKSKIDAALDVRPEYLTECSPREWKEIVESAEAPVSFVVADSPTQGSTWPTSSPPMTMPE